MSSQGSPKDERELRFELREEYRRLYRHVHSGPGPSIDRRSLTRLNELRELLNQDYQGVLA